MFHGFIRGLAWVVMHLLSYLKVEGRENLREGNVVYVCNHQSVLDLFFLFYLLPSDTWYMAKKELLENKVFGKMLSKLQVFGVDRSRVDLKAVKYACSVLQENKCLCIFPQGTRRKSPVIRLDELHNGVGMFALREKSTVIPMMYESKPGFFKKNVLHIGRPLDLTSFEGRRLNNEAMTEFTEQMGKAMNELLPEKIKAKAEETA